MSASAKVIPRFTIFSKRKIFPRQCLYETLLRQVLLNMPMFRTLL